jgi:hypothetical protein
MELEGYPRSENVVGAHCLNVNIAIKSYQAITFVVINNCLNVLRSFCAPLRFCITIKDRPCVVCRRSNPRCQVGAGVDSKFMYSLSKVLRMPVLLRQITIVFVIMPAFLNRLSG